VTVSEYRTAERVERFGNKVFTLVSDQVVMPDGATAQRDYLRHVGAVAAVALDDEDQVLLIRQYRHPVGAELWELPAGLTDVPGESAVDSARRELAEEADLTAERWDVLLDLHPTPGCSSEHIRVYLARGVADVPEHEQHQREHEEAGLTRHWVPLPEAVRMVLAGEITNATAAAGILAAARCRDNDWAGLRPAQ